MRIAERSAVPNVGNALTVNQSIDKTEPATLNIQDGCGVNPSGNWEGQESSKNFAWGSWYQYWALWERWEVYDTNTEDSVILTDEN